MLFPPRDLVLPRAGRIGIGLEDIVVVSRSQSVGYVVARTSGLHYEVENWIMSASISSVEGKDWNLCMNLLHM